MPGGMPTANIGGERIKEFVALPPLEGPDGVRLSVHEPCNYLLYPNVFVITKDCEYPEAVFKWADYMYDEEVSMRSRLGEPGVDWVEAEEGEVIWQAILHCIKQFCCGERYTVPTGIIEPDT